MARPEQVLLPQIDYEGRVTVHLHFETDRMSAYHLRRAWLTALNAIAVANDCPRDTVVHRIAHLQALKALDHYFEQIDSSLLPR